MGDEYVSTGSLDNETEESDWSNDDEESEHELNEILSPTYMRQSIQDGDDQSLRVGKFSPSKSSALK